MVITLLGENNAGATPSQDELMEWAEEFGLNHPVVADEGLSVTARFVEGNSIGLPSMDLLAPDTMEVVIADSQLNEGDVTGNLP